MSAVGRNEPCPCASGKKYKRCCLANDEPRKTHADEEKARGGPAQQMVDFIQPLLEGAEGDTERMQKAMNLGMLFWNIAVSKDDVREELLQKLLEGDAAKTEEARTDFREIAEMMIQRHRDMFPELHR